jgi:hypothetical protein
MCLATGANFDFRLAGMNRKYCIMLKDVKNLKIEPVLVCVLSKVKIL